MVQMKSRFRVLISVAALFVLLASSAHAVVITESLYGKIGSSGGDIYLSDFNEYADRTEIHLFDITYDNEGTSFDMYYSDGRTVTHDYYNNSAIAFASNVQLTTFYFLNNLRLDYGGGSYFNFSSDYIFERDSGGSQFTSYQFDYALNYLAGVNAYDHIDYSLYNADDTRSWMYFTDIRKEEIPTPAPPVPEPSTILLLSSGLIGLVGWNRRKKSRK